MIFKEAVANMSDDSKVFLFTVVFITTVTALWSLVTVIIDYYNTQIILEALTQGYDVNQINLLTIK